jgi:short subunit dehydrogenase-like uncharacterized protein
MRRTIVATSCSVCNLASVVLEVWEIVLLVWIVVIPASVALLTALAAKRRAARLRGSVHGATDQPGQLLRLAVHARSHEHMRATGAAHRGALRLGHGEQFRD